MSKFMLASKRLVLPAALAAAFLASIPPAPADDASDFFALFDRTCAKSLTNQQAFIDAAKAAGATFKFANSGRSEAQMGARLGRYELLGHGRPAARAHVVDVRHRFGRQAQRELHRPRAAAFKSYA